MELTVKVLDKLGRAVQGARVLFTADGAGGGFVDEGGTAVGVWEAETDNQGLASVPLRLGELTELQPTFLLDEDPEKSAVRALLHCVEVTADSEAGTLAVESPFEALGFPGEPVAFRRLDSEVTDFYGRASDHVDTMTLLVEDQHGNPVSNREITVAVTDSSRDDQACENPPPTVPLEAVVYEHETCPLPHPFLGDCGSGAASSPSSAVGSAMRQDCCRPSRGA